MRVAALQAIGDLVACPFPEKCRGAASECIAELVGHRDDNILPVAAFYRAETTLNRFAKLVLDEAPSVRCQLQYVIADWLLRLPDKYDHEGRLAPYLLSGLNDTNVELQSFCLETLNQLGRAYAAENQDDVSLLEMILYTVLNFSRCI